MGSLVNAGLVAMRNNGRPLTKTPGRGNIYRLSNDETVRIRTCNRHVLLVNAEHPDPDAKLDIEGTDWLLVVMPERERTEGQIIAYLIPTSVAVAEMRRAHRKWLATNPATGGDNKTWTLAFKELTAHDNCAIKWAKYRLGRET